ncbi:hemolysin family protein [Rossellomorea oryzaecorticis]|uniref:Hemolysin family protein n=1 Tax=Rossellomorea oryzaecorticis TaxID=1396505 RepID=A0ABW8VTF8_9BACI|nr:hemolysin family protein [[Bacillus] enclensis]MBH9966287.1 HlyC/CorC family transporter [[Bacillus] enclensis]OAT81962.1 hypothetical protein A6P54_10670 [Bacillus sp. MKU004]QTC41651.1 HlyC/CorC family transporter [Bacillus sp. V3]QWC23730.1 hemolysin family protein [Bacillus haikouensis]
MTTSINLLLIALLIALTAFFVATEFAIVKVRGSKIDQLVAEGRKGSMAAKKVVTHLDEYLSACQLGITITALGLGWLGEPTVEKILHPLFAYMELNETLTHLLSFGIAFALVTFLHVVVGELAPKTVAIQKAEAVTLLFAGPIIWFYRVMYPFIWLLNGSARVFVGIFGLKTASEHDEVHTEEELRILLSESYQSGEINKNELKYVNNIFEFDERIAKEIMVPRKEIVSLSIDDTFADVVETLRKENFTRYPVIDGDKDNIKGFVNMKELLTETVTRNLEEDHFRVHSFLNPIITVIETIAIHDLLVKMQKERVHIAVLIDEYGGTAGIVTVEDILEEIVGEIRDEFDEDEVAEVRKLKDGHYLLDSKVLINEVNALLGISIDVGELDIDTIGGWFMTHNINSKIGSVIEEEGYRFKIIEKDGIQLRYLEVTKL